MFNKLLFTSLAVFLAGCAGTPPPPQGDATVASSDKLVCEMITPTGSHMKKRVCRYESDIKNDERTVDMLQDRMNRGGPIDEIRNGNDL